MRRDDLKCPLGVRRVAVQKGHATSRPLGVRGMVRGAGRTKIRSRVKCSRPLGVVLDIALAYVALLVLVAVLVLVLTLVDLAVLVECYCLCATCSQIQIFTLKTHDVAKGVFCCRDPCFDSRTRTLITPFHSMM